jgi:hypothetical protein
MWNRSRWRWWRSARMPFAHRPGLPDIRAVVPDRAVGGELADPRHIQDRHARPSLPGPCRQAHAVLAVDVGLVIGQQHVVVAVSRELTSGSNRVLSPWENSPLVSESSTSRRFGVRRRGARIVALALALLDLGKWSVRRGRSSPRPPLRESRCSRRPACRW